LIKFTILKNLPIRYLTIYIIITIYCLNTLAQSASSEFCKLIRDSPEKSRAVFIGEIHGIEEYQEFTGDVFVSLIDKDTSGYQIYLEFPFAANYIVSDYLQSGDENVLRKLSELVLSEKGYVYSREFILALLKSLHKLKEKRKKPDVFFTDILHTDKMLFDLLRDRVKRTGDNKFPLRLVDSLLMQDSVVLTHSAFDTIKKLIAVNEKFITEKYGIEINNWIKEIFVSNYCHLAKDTVVRYRDRVFFERISKTFDKSKKQLFLYGVAHVRNVVHKTSHQNLFELLQQNGLIAEENALRIILIAKKRDKIALPDLNAGLYGLTDYNLKKKNYRIFSRKSYPVKPVEQKDNVDYVILFREVHSLTKKQAD
jgi:hypothetical protein